MKKKQKRGRKGQGRKGSTFALLAQNGCIRVQIAFFIFFKPHPLSRLGAHLYRRCHLRLAGRVI
jgi:hypothetical protein